MPGDDRKRALEDLKHGRIQAVTSEKAREVVTGSLNTLSAGQYYFIESTAEGRDGVFFDMVSRSRALQEMQGMLTPLDFRFFFSPWWRCPEYCLQSSIMWEGNTSYRMLFAC
jgi:hypothetical protein